MIIFFENDFLGNWLSLKMAFFENDLRKLYYFLRKLLSSKNTFCENYVLRKKHFLQNLFLLLRGAAAVRVNPPNPPPPGGGSVWAYGRTCGSAL